MNFTIIEAEQRSLEWHRARAGRLTGSVSADMLAKIKSGEAAARRDLRLKLAVERIVGASEDDGYVSPEMRRGIDSEPEILGAYEAVRGVLVRRTGFLSHQSLMVGCSLDGDVNDFEGITEWKAPKSATHLRYIKGGVVPSEYVPQCTHNMWVSGAKWCDFVSWDGRMPAHLQLFIVRMVRDEAAIAAYAVEANRFLAEVAVETEEIRNMRIAA